MRRYSLLGMILIACFLATACKTTRHFDGETYRDKETRYRIGKLSSSWKRLNVEEQNDLAWYNKSVNSVIQVNSSCDRALDIPLVALTNHLLIGFTNREYKEQVTVQMAEREALRTLVNAKLDGVPKEMIMQILKKDGCVYDFALIASPGEDFEAAKPDFDAMLAGFES